MLEKLFRHMTFLYKTASQLLFTSAGVVFCCYHYLYIYSINHIIDLISEWFGDEKLYLYDTKNSPGKVLYR